MSAVVRATTNLTQPEQYSPAHGPPADAWNPLGNGAAEALVPFPVALLSTEDTARVGALVERNREVGYGSFPQHVLEFSFYMGPDDMDSAWCIANSKCKPLGGVSVWGVAGALLDPDEDAAAAVLASAPRSAAHFGVAKTDPKCLNAPP